VRCAVVGHVEWVEFARVPRLPESGTIVHAHESWTDPAGAGPVMARQLARLAGRCEFFTVLGDDELGHRSERRLAELGIDVHAEHRASTRRAWTHIDGNGERTITVLGDKLLPRAPLPLGGYDAVYFVSGEPSALHAARAAPFVAATAREQATLREAGVPLDLLVGSLNDETERFQGGVDAANVVLTDGGRGCIANGERFPAAALPGPVVDTYGAGDSFAAALCFALARRDSLADAVALASRAGAAVITGKGPYTSQLTLDG
jgi:ribokinase